MENKSLYVCIVINNKSSKSKGFYGYPHENSTGKYAVSVAEPFINITPVQDIHECSVGPLTKI